MMRFVICVAVLSAVVGVTACSQQQSETVPAGRQTPAVTVTAVTDIATLRLLADQGNPEAQYALGFRYQYGQGVETDNAQAAKGYRQTADQGLADAQYNLGVMYGTGHGVPQDVTQAIAWWRNAADQGHADAQYNLGLMYATGQGVAQDVTQAMVWYRQAADQGHAAAQASLGVMYDLGQGVPQDYVEAHKWLSLAASSLTGDTQKGYAEYRNATAKLMTPAQLAEAQKRAADWHAAFEKRQPN